MSALENHVDDYLRLRRTLGYDLLETGRLLHRFAGRARRHRRHARHDAGRGAVGTCRRR